LLKIGFLVNSIPNPHIPFTFTQDAPQEEIQPQIPQNRREDEEIDYGHYRGTFRPRKIRNRRDPQY
jgi:hypothetical protein